ncbi:MULTISPECIES: glycosyltransferase family 52 [Glaesserella]|uniref:CMP-N-acetylneuraminate-beta-galactosamide-alpha-2, 3-sialyltransferase n=1 Tax=Glaesserella australis TaxID=2094024 RepID=A0A328BWC5_9PAST|nr:MULTISPECIES: glycosyltransferase family 52 [Glaesserella]AUI65264.1 CMP-N-acetylneuraminate-beta-galactosamide-alpha-2, 3-sialyltransferase [Glaesserella sp. 15-184]RAL18536.1 CMP-N-acetylneuraminate-beta-galactosamide-alpha-2, 3-sialyltransferase [Glaesserella australis]
MNLIICYTPLQVLLAEKIIALHPSEKFYGVMLCSVKNAKFDYYAERLSQKCEQFFVMKQSTDRFNLLKEIAYLRIKFFAKSFDKVFVASINDIQIQFILSSTRFKAFYTFDDGTANIANHSVYYTDEPKTMIRRLINTLFCNKYSVAKLKSISQKHYTIYKGLPNIIENTEYIDIFSSESTQDVEGETVKILLGQPVYLDFQKNIDLAEKVIKRFDIDYYLPHPREQYKLNNVEYIQTPLILEDYLAQEFKNKKCRIYTYFSSAVLNIKDKSKNIDVVALRIHVDNPDFIQVYELFEKLGVNIIDIRE